MQSSLVGEYCNRVQYKQVTPEEWQRYRNYPTTQQRNHLVKRNVYLVLKVAQRHARRNPMFEKSDLEGQGHIGLIRAVENYDPDKGCRFSSYAAECIDSAILHYMRDTGRTMVKVTRSWVEFASYVRNHQKRLAKDSGVWFPLDDIAATLAGERRFNMDFWDEAKAITRNLPYTPLHAEDDDDRDIEPVAPVTADYGPIHDAIAELPEPYHSLIRLHYFGGVPVAEVEQRLNLEQGDGLRVLKCALSRLRTTASTTANLDGKYASLTIR